MRRKAGNTDTCAEIDALIVELDWSLQRFLYAGRNPAGLCERGVAQQDRKLVAAQAGNIGAFQKLCPVGKIGARAPTRQPLDL